MESLTCALGSGMLELPGRLEGLLQRHRHMLPKGAEYEIPLMKQDLEKMIAILLSTKYEGRASMVNFWKKEVRKLLYDLEDFVDQYEHSAAGSHGRFWSRRIPDHRIIRWRRRRKTNWVPEKLRLRLWMANKIREFSMRVQQAIERHSMCNLGASGNVSARCTDSSFRSWAPAPCGDDVHYHVGLDTTINMLEEWLMTVQGTEEQKLKVVSVVGPGGIGKTTLANELYHNLGRQFESWAFVRTSQKPDIRRILTSMLSQVRPYQHPENWNVPSLISSIRAHLEDRRYLIIIDDLWESSTWDVLKSALPDGNSHSRILTTTEIEDIALQSCGYESKYVFKMKPLSENDSKKLFFSSVFGPHGECPPELMKYSNYIIRKSGGFPLAIVTIAGILSNQLHMQKQWDYVSKSIGFTLMTDPTLEGMKQVINLGLDSLPQHLKACLLYTNIYEEDNIIWKDDLLNQWIAEGFICVTEGQEKQDVSMAYFDELVGRKMIHPVHIKSNGEVLSCVVHHMVHHLVKYRSMEENFVTAIHHSQVDTTLADRVRRLSLHYGNAEDAMPPTNIILSQIRTLAFFGVFKCMPSFVEFRLLQVLILHLWGDTDTISLDMTRVSELFRLRYLKVASNSNLQVHTQMRGPQSLETLHIDARVTAILSDITHLPGSRHGSLPVETSLPNWIGHMTSLRTLGYIDLNADTVVNMQNLSNLTNIQDIRLTCYPTVLESDNKNAMQGSLRSILEKLGNLRSLTLVSKAYSHTSSLYGVGSQKKSISSLGFSGLFPPTLLQRFELSPRICIFSCLPKFIEQLGKLCFLKIGVNEMIEDDVDVLRRLPCLVVLSLYVHTKLTERIIIAKDGFSVLKYFKFKSCDPWLKFEIGAMCNLRKLKLGFNANRCDQQSAMAVGMEHLSSLREVSAKIGGGSPDGILAELAFRDAMRIHEGHPRVSILCVNEIFGCMDDPVSIEREEDCGTRKLYETGLDVEGSIEGKEGDKDADDRKGKRRIVPTKHTVIGSPDWDGFSWRLFSVQSIQGAKHQRYFYGCSHNRSCRARKTVQRTSGDDDPALFDVWYSGEHTCGVAEHRITVTTSSPDDGDGYSSSTAVQTQGLPTTDVPRWAA